MMRSLLVSLATLLLVSALALGDTVILENGRRIRGKVLSDDAAEVVVEVEGLGKMKFPRKSVKEIVISKEPRRRRKPPPAPPTEKPAPAPSPDPAPQRPKPKPQPKPDPRPKPQSEPNPEPAATGSTAETGWDFVRWSDAKGDIETAFDPKGWKRPDLTELKVAGNDRFVDVTLTFADDVMRVLGQKTKRGMMKGYDLVEVYLDVDDDAATGRRLTVGPKSPGWDFAIRVMTGIESQDAQGNSMSFWGNVASLPGKHKPKRALITFDVKKHGSGTVTIRDPRGKTLTVEELTKVSGREIRVRVPYPALGVRKGARIRACFADNQQELLTDGLVSEPAHFELR